jgi:hypothetical protein
MFLIWIRTDNGNIAPQKWQMHPSTLTSGYFKSLIVQAVSLPPEDYDLPLDVLVAKYGKPEVVK